MSSEELEQTDSSTPKWLLDARLGQRNRLKSPYRGLTKFLREHGYTVVTYYSDRVGKSHVRKVKLEIAKERTDEPMDEDPFTSDRWIRFDQEEIDKLTALVQQWEPKAEVLHLRGWSGWCVVYTWRFERNYDE